MSFRDELSVVIRKKALGFNYTEETVECETVKPKPYVFCERANRLYLGDGYVMVKVRKKNGDIVALEHFEIENIVSKKNILKHFKALKLKGFSD